MREVLIEIALVVIPLLGGFLAIYLKKKTKELSENMKTSKQKKYIDIAGDVVQVVVQRLNQTLVDGLKKAHLDGKLTKDEIKEVGELCKDEVILTLNREAIEVLSEVYGDLDIWLKSKMESEVGKEQIALIDIYYNGSKE